MLLFFSSNWFKIDIMYSQDPEIRRRRVKLRFFAYGIMTLATVLFGIVSLYYILGYRIDNSLGVQRGGLLKFDSRPQGARVTLDGQDIQSTPHQTNADAGEHTVSYSKDGYQGWQKTVNLRPGEVLWLNYARLVPTSITTSAIRDFSSIHQASASPNREWYIVHATPAQAEFTLVDARNESDVKNTQISIPKEAFTAGAGKHVFEIQEWSRDSRFVLVRHTAGKTVEFIRVSRENPSESINLNKLFDIPLVTAQFAANNPNALFAKDTHDTLYRLDVNNKENPLEIADAVSSYDDLNVSEVAYIGQASVNETTDADKKVSNRVLYIWRDNEKTPKELRTVPADSAAHVSYNPYLAHDYVSLAFENSISVIQDPLSSTKTVMSDVMPTTAASLEASPGSRFFIMQNKSSVYVYDIELGRSYQFTVPAQNSRPLQWADDHHLVLSGGNSLRLVEFDGMNTQQITSVAGSYDALFGADGEVMLSIGKNTATGKPELQQSFLLTEADRNSFL